MNTLVALPSSLEEVIRLLPTLEALAANDRHLLTLIEPTLTPLLRLSRAKPEPLPRLAELATTRAIVRTAGCDEGIVLSERLDDAWLVRSAGIPRGWAYRSLLVGGWLLSHRVRRPRRRQRAQQPVSEDCRELLTAMQVPWRTSVPRLIIDESRRDEARQRLERAHIRLGEGPLIGLYPGIVGGSCDRPWPRIRFEEVARQLRRKEPLTQIVVLARTRDLWRAVRLHEETGKIHPVIGPDLQLDVLASLLAELHVVIAAESSMLDLAAAAGTRTVGLHLRDPRRWGPPGELHRALHSGKAGTIGAIQCQDVLDSISYSL